MREHGIELERGNNESTAQAFGFGLSEDVFR